MRLAVAALGLAACSTTVANKPPPTAARPPSTAAASSTEKPATEKTATATEKTATEKPATAGMIALFATSELEFAPLPPTGALDARAEPGVGDDHGRGELSPTEIRRVIRSKMLELRACYEAARATQPTLAGRLSVRFTIGVDGAVTSTEVVTGLEPAVDRCVARVVRAAVFPPPRGGGVVVVNYPFHFDAAP